MNSGRDQYTHLWKFQHLLPTLATDAGYTRASSVDDQVWLGVGCGPLFETVTKEQYGDTHSCSFHKTAIPSVVGHLC